MLDSMPKGLVPKLQGMRLAGSFALAGTATSTPRTSIADFALDWDAANTLPVAEAPPEISRRALPAAVPPHRLRPRGPAALVETGPGTADWVPSDRISKFMEVAVLTTEDGGFHRHHGFDHEAIRNCDPREPPQARGSSAARAPSACSSPRTSTSTAARTSSRKLQEAVLTMYLEQELTKEQILELYLNVVEFGPMVYGIGPAARYYFNTAAGELSLGQALYISSIMPNPKIQHFGAGGAVSPTWMSYLRKLMKIARDRGNLTDDELDDGLRETVVRGSPAPHRGRRADATAGSESSPARRAERPGAPTPERRARAAPAAARRTSGAARRTHRRARRLYREAVVQPRILPDREERVDRARLGIRAAVHEPRHARVHQRAGAHRAGLQRDVDGGALEPPVAERGRRAAQRVDLGVRRRILVGLAPVAPPPHDLPGGVDHHGAHGHVARGGRRLGLRHRLAHEALVPIAVAHAPGLPRRARGR